MPAPAEESLQAALRSVAQCFEQLQVPYLVIGGIAQAVIGEPRMTHDVDCIIAVLHDRLEDVLTGLQHAGFEVDQGAARAQVASTGTFSVTRGRWRVDLIVASTEFEQSAFRRAQRMRLFDVDIPLPTPEDFVLLKLVPGREKDLLDAKIVLIRHRDRLDRVYLEQWAQRLSDEAEDSRIWQTLQRLLKEADERPSG